MFVSFIVIGLIVICYGITWLVDTFTPATTTVYHVKDKMIRPYNGMETTMAGKVAISSPTNKLAFLVKDDNYGDVVFPKDVYNKLKINDTVNVTTHFSHTNYEIERNGTKIEEVCF